MTATEVMMRQEQAIKTASFIPEVWSQQILDTMKQTMWETVMPRRSHGAQLLRDVALGKPEFGPEMGDGMRPAPNPASNGSIMLGSGDTVELTNFTITVPGV